MTRKLLRNSILASSDGQTTPCLEELISDDCAWAWIRRRWRIPHKAPSSTWGTEKVYEWIGHGGRSMSIEGSDRVLNNPPPLFFPFLMKLFSVLCSLELVEIHWDLDCELGICATHQCMKQYSEIRWRHGAEKSCWCFQRLDRRIPSELPTVWQEICMVSHSVMLGDRILKG